MDEQKPIDDEILWGEPDKFVSPDSPGQMSAEEIDEATALWGED